MKHLSELKVLAEMVGQDFKSMPKQDMMTLIGRIERMDVMIVSSFAISGDAETEMGCVRC